MQSQITQTDVESVCNQESKPKFGYDITCPFNICKQASSQFGSDTTYPFNICNKSNVFGSENTPSSEPKKLPSMDPKRKRFDSYEEQIKFQSIIVPSDSEPVFNRESNPPYENPFTDFSDWESNPDFGPRYGYLDNHYSKPSKFLDQHFGYAVPSFQPKFQRGVSIKEINEKEKSADFSNIAWDERPGNNLNEEFSPSELLAQTKKASDFLEKNAAQEFDTYKGTGSFAGLFGLPRPSELESKVRHAVDEFISDRDLLIMHRQGKTVVFDFPKSMEEFKMMCLEMRIEFK